MLLSKRQHGKTWDSVPTIDGSRWGFIGAMAAILVVLIIALVVCICVCRKRGNNKRMRKSAVGSNLTTLHPTPSFGRSRKPGRQRTEDYEEANAFGASSPRHSVSYAGPVEGERYKYNENVHLNDMNNRYYRGSDGYHQGHQPYGQEETQYADPEYDQSQQHAGVYGHDYAQHHNAGLDSAPGQYSYPQAPQAASQYSSSARTTGPRTQPGVPSPVASPYPSHASQNAPSTYPQEPFSQAPYSQDHSSSGAFHEPYSSQGGGHGQEYAPYPAEQAAPPAYPENSHTHNHDLPKGRMGPAAV